MSGHSKWSSIKHKKGALDAKRGKLFSKLIKEITVAARIGGGDPGANPRLRTILDKARAANMPGDNVARAIKKGTGELEGFTFEEVTFEGYGPGGAAVLVETLTDNRNRTVAELRHMFTKNGGNMGEAGCVSWMFTKRGVLTFDKSIGEEKLMELCLDAGAEDILEDEDLLTVLTEPTVFEKVRETCNKQGLKPLDANITMVPQNTIKLEGTDAEKMLKLMEALEDHDDVQNVSANFDIDTKTMEAVA
ncbi:MAG: transcriptional regulator [Deltaproteobacteria bacterium RIFCSPLOWO2_02_FULL_44_10]|nr:MAG: transcriptional regulator [Deltaproteobacteria bacterium RIFCSPHIGHO2_02_FULL_44_16]OGQ46068.1 MAG: transcriptional regulator [Deltaproteobacteria bacterium RIFCSPLOWO2_02_FULL_44_10]